MRIIHAHPVGTVSRVTIDSETRRTQPNRAEWPLLAKPLKLMAKPTDRGLGDIVARVVGPVGGDAFKLWYKRTFGRDCGCGDRQKFLNTRFPLP